MLKRLFAVLLMVIVTITTGCSTKETRLPEDYSFSLTWGVYGVSSYDSSTGKLVKTTVRIISCEGLVITFWAEFGELNGSYSSG